MRNIKDFDLSIGILPVGKRNQITDVPGVRVGHFTYAHEAVQTGVTLVLPNSNAFETPYVAAAQVFNGYGKSVGLMQIEEIGALESPIALTSTLNVGRVADALVTYTIEQNGTAVQTFNPVVLECNDTYLNDIQKRVVNTEAVYKAIESAETAFDEGAVGGGRGMSSFGLKGGIGSASRCLEFGGVSYTLGVLVQSNFGKLEDLMVAGRSVGVEISRMMTDFEPTVERGSIVLVMATDLPLTSRQIGRVLRRMPLGIARTGGHMGHGSGELAIGFTTAHMHLKRQTSAEMNGDQTLAAAAAMQVLSEPLLDDVFRAVIEATEDAILSALFSSEPVAGVHGHRRESLHNWMLRIGNCCPYCLGPVNQG